MRRARSAARRRFLVLFVGLGPSVSAMDPCAGISGAELLTTVFGYWPSFHDAEVVRLRLETTEPFACGPSLAADIHAFEMTSEVGTDGRYVLRHHVLVTLRFSGVDALELDGFTNQNALGGLRIKDIRARQLEELKYQVCFDGACGMCAQFLCRAIAVDSVCACTADGVAVAT